MKTPKLRLVLLAFLLSVFSCFVITACTPEQPKQPVSNGTPTAKAKLTPTPEPTATPTPEPTATPTPEPTATPTPTYTSTPSNPNSDAKNRSDKSKNIVGRWQSRYNATNINGNYQIITTVEFYLDGTYKFRQYDTSKDPLRFQDIGQWKRTDENTIFASFQNPDSGKVIEFKYRIIDQDTIIDYYGHTFIRLP